MASKEWNSKDHDKDSPISWAQAIGPSCFDTYSSLMANTFEFARADRITPEAANILAKHMDKLVPVEELYSWVAKKQRKKSSDPLPQNCTERAPGAKNTFKPITDPQEIRVIEIHPGRFDDMLEGTLHHCSLEFEHFIDKDWPNDPSVNKQETRHALSCENLRRPVWYTALSYTWGESNPGTDSVIVCNQFKLKITRSLDVALRHFRQADHSINMWIDQICIDQSNTDEKARMVPLMTKIYRYAINTVAWLGKATDGSNEAFDLLLHVGLVLQGDGDLQPEEFERIGLPTSTAPIWRHVWELINREWFTRLWIIQEVILSKNLWVMCGKKKAFWGEFSLGLTNMDWIGLSNWLERVHGGSGPGTKTVGWKMLRFMDAMHTQYHAFQTRPSLFDMLIATRSACASIAEDKIYGLLGVCGPTDIKISYDGSVTVAELYREATMLCLGRGVRGGNAEGGDFIKMRDILLSIDHQSLPKGLPSWVPDWSLGRRTTSLGFGGASHCTYAASNTNVHFSSPRSAQFSISTSGKELLIEQGISFDVIKDVSEVCLVTDLAFEDPKTFNKHLFKWVSLAKRCHPYPAQCTLFDAFWHTLVADQSGDGRKTSPTSFSEIFSLVLDESTGSSPTFRDQTYSARQIRPHGKGRLELASLGARTPRKTYDEICSAMERTVLHRRVGTTESRYLGLLPRQAQPGDLIYVLNGFHVPYVLRKAGNAQFTCVGECYVHGIMNGEAMGMDIPYSKITII